MSRPNDELLYSLIISQLKDDGFLEEAESLQCKVCPQGVILNLKPGNDSPVEPRPDSSRLEKFSGVAPEKSDQRARTSSGAPTSEERIGELGEGRLPLAPLGHGPSAPEPPAEQTPAEPPITGEDEQKWKKEMEHMRFDFKLSRKVDYKIHNYDPCKKRTVVLDEKTAKRMKGSSAQGKFFHIKMTKDTLQPEEQRGPVINKPSNSRVKLEETSEKANLQDFLQKITIPMDKLN